MYNWFVLIKGEWFDLVQFSRHVHVVYGCPVYCSLMATLIAFWLTSNSEMGKKNYSSRLDCCDLVIMYTVYCVWWNINSEHMQALIIMIIASLNWYTFMLQLCKCIYSRSSTIIQLYIYTWTGISLACIWWTFKELNIPMQKHFSIGNNTSITKHNGITALLP